MSFSTPPAVDRQTFYASQSAVVVALNKSMLSISNGASGKVLKIQNVYIINSQVTNIVGNVVQFDLLRTTSITLGTNVVPTSYDSLNALPVQVTVAIGATVVDASTSPLHSWILGGDEAGTGTATNQGIDKALSQFAPNLAAQAMQLPTVRPGEGIHIKASVVPAAVGQWLLGVLFTLE